MNILKAKWYGVSAVVFVLVGILCVGAIAYAAVTVTLHGSVKVVSPVVKTYTFEVWDAVTGGNRIDSGDSTFMALGNITASQYVDKIIYVEKTGTGNITVTPSATWTGSQSGTITFTPSFVTVTTTARVPIVVRFTAGDTTADTEMFDIHLNGTPAPD
jgi:hypothetical protein